MRYYKTRSNCNLNSSTSWMLLNTREWTSAKQANSIALKYVRVMRALLRFSHTTIDAHWHRVRERWRKSDRTLHWFKIGRNKQWTTTTTAEQQKKIKVTTRRFFRVLIRNIIRSVSNFNLCKHMQFRIRCCLRCALNAFHALAVAVAEL